VQLAAEMESSLHPIPLRQVVRVPQQAHRAVPLTAPLIQPLKVVVQAEARPELHALCANVRAKKVIKIVNNRKNFMSVEQNRYQDRIMDLFQMT